MKYWVILFFLFFSFRSMGQNKLSFYFPGTKIVKQNVVFLDSNSNPETFLENFYPNGNKKSEGNAVDYKPHGVWNYYDTAENLIENYNHDLQFNFNYTTQTILGIDSFEEKKIDLNFLDNFDEPPHFIGGNFELLDYLKSNIRYPILAKNDTIEGCIVVSLTIDERGNLINPKVLR